MLVGSKGKRGSDAIDFILRVSNLKTGEGEFENCGVASKGDFAVSANLPLRQVREGNLRLRAKY